jgi:uncharacterized hydrophobic protein (TIGR00341 family)
MATRLIDVYARRPPEHLDALLGEAEVLDRWASAPAEGPHHVRLLVREDEVEATTDAITKRMGDEEGFRLVVTDVRATLPRPPEREEPAAEAPDATAAPDKGRPSRVSRAELVEAVERGLRSTWVYAWFVLLSTVVACAGLLRDDPALILGAMVIAPLLGPNMALSLATTLGDAGLGRRALRMDVLGFLLCLGLAAFAGLVFPLDGTTSEMARRTSVGVSDVVVALAAGAAGALSLTTGAPSTLIGVMVAVALLPPLANAGLLLGAGHPGLAGRSGLLVLANLVCVNLAALGVFAAQRVAPVWFWEIRRSRTWVALAFLVWLAALAAVVVLILVLAGRPTGAAS